MFGKFGRRLRYIGEKLAAGAQWIGQKVGGALLSAAPVITAINPGLGGLAVSAGGVLEGVGTLGSIASRALDQRRVGVDTVSQVRGALGGIRDDARAVRDAYNTFRGSIPTSRLERRR